jgi:hypothetical protein
VLGLRCNQLHKKEKAMKILRVAEILGMKLNSSQMKRVRAVEWLLDDNLTGEGRTTLLALGFIAKAMTFPGKAIRIFDHLPVYGAMGQVIMGIVDSKGLGQDFVMEGDAMLYVRREDESHRAEEEAPRPGG